MALNAFHEAPAIGTLSLQQWLVELEFAQLVGLDTTEECSTFGQV